MALNMLDVLNKKKIEINKERVREKKNTKMVYIYTDFWLTPRIMILNS
jgi:Fe2+ transport system protein B